MKKICRYSFILLLLFCMCFGISKIEARTLGDLKAELNTMKAKRSATKAEQAQKVAAKQEVDAKLSSINNEIQQAQTDIDNLNKDIEKRNVRIDEMNEEIKNITHYYQVSNSSSMYLEYVFNAKDFTDFIYRLAVAEQLSEYRRQSINEYRSLIEKNKQQIKETAAKEVELKELQGQLSEETKKLGSELSTITDGMIDIDDEIKDLEAAIKDYQSRGCSDGSDLNSCGGGTGGGGIPSAAGFYRPVASGVMGSEFGRSAWYFDYSVFHYGIDIETGVGTPVFPIADGKVVKINYRSSCGGNMIFIAHNVRGATYTSGYYHLHSINVSVGQQVSHNTQIGSSGGRESFDSCSTGAHLHLQTAYGLYMTDYASYSVFEKNKSFNPRNIINMPAFHQRFSGR